MLARRNQILQELSLPRSHPGWSFPSSWWVGAEPGDKSHPCASHPFGAGRYLRGIRGDRRPWRGCCVGKEGAAGASWSACHVAADDTGTKRLMAHGSVSFRREALPRNFHWEERVLHCMFTWGWGGAGSGGYPSPIRKQQGYFSQQFPLRHGLLTVPKPPLLHLAALQRALKAKEQR